MTEQFKTELTESIRNQDPNNFCTHVKEMLETWLTGDFNDTDTIPQLTKEFMHWYAENTPAIRVDVIELEEAFYQGREEWGEWFENVSDRTEIYLTVCFGGFTMNWECYDPETGREYKPSNPSGNYNDFADFLPESHIVR